MTEIINTKMYEIFKANSTLQDVMFFKTSYKWLLPLVGFPETTSVQLNINRPSCDYRNALLHPIISQIT